MSDVVLGAAFLGAFGLLTFVLIAVLADGVYQAFSGRPGFWPIERIFRKRMPATELDCVRQGVSKILQAAALGCIEAPTAVTGVQSLASLMGAIPSGPHAPPPVIVDVLVFVGLFGPISLGAALAIAAYAISTRVKYVAVEPRLLTT